MADSYAEVSDLEARWRPLTSEEEIVAETLLGDASQMIRDRWPATDANIASGALSLDTVIRIVCGMVKRAMIVGDFEGVESGAVTTGPFSESRKFANPNGNLYLSASDIATLDGYNAPTAKVGWLC